MRKAALHVLSHHFADFRFKSWYKFNLKYVFSVTVSLAVKSRPGREAEDIVMLEKYPLTRSMSEVQANRNLSAKTLALTVNGWLHCVPTHLSSDKNKKMLWYCMQSLLILLARYCNNHFNCFNFTKFMLLALVLQKLTTRISMY